MPAKDTIAVEGLVKTYGSLTAVKGITFHVKEREIFGFLGPNGAGKTTTIKILSTLLHPTSGRAEVAGHDVMHDKAKVRQNIGLVFQDPTLDDRLTAQENLLFHGLLYGLSREQVAERSGPLLEMVDLKDRRNSLVRTFSGGMKRRLELVRGLLHHPTVLFLDEPTVGLDPQTRAHIWRQVRSLSEHEGVTVFVTTHYMDEAENCSRIAIMDHGEIVALDSPEGLKRSMGDEVLQLELDDSSARAEIVRRLDVEVKGEGVLLQIESEDAAGMLSRVAEVAGTHMRRAEIRRPTLDDVFLNLTGREIRDESAGAADRFRQMGRRWRR